MLGGYCVTISHLPLIPMARLTMYQSETPIGLVVQILRSVYLSGQKIAMAFLQTGQVMLT